MKTKKIVDTRTTTRLELTAEDILVLLRRSGENISMLSNIYYHKGDDCYDINEFCPVVIEITETENESILC